MRSGPSIPGFLFHLFVRELVQLLQLVLQRAHGGQGGRVRGRKWARAADAVEQLQLPHDTGDRVLVALRYEGVGDGVTRSRVAVRVCVQLAVCMARGVSAPGWSGRATPGTSAVRWCPPAARLAGGREGVAGGRECDVNAWGKG